MFYDDRVIAVFPKEEEQIKVNFPFFYYLFLNMEKHFKRIRTQNKSWFLG